MKPVVILSPHLDDAVLSCWNALNSPHAAVITIFAGIPSKGIAMLWDRVCGEPDSAEMMQKRRAENETVFQRLGVVFYNLNYLDGQYHPSHRDIPKIAKAVLEKADSNVAFLVPAAASHLWRHPDHITVREVGKYLATQGKDVAFYADVPYMQMPERQSAGYERRMARRAGRYVGVPMTTEIVELPAEVQLSKREAMRSYGTQYKMMNVATFGMLGRDANVQREVIFRETAQPLSRVDTAGL